MAATPDYYKILGVATYCHGRRDKEGVPQAGAQAPPRRRRRRGEVQGDQRGLRGALRRQEARAVRPVRHRATRTRSPTDGAAAVERRRHLRQAGAAGGFGSWADILESIRRGEGAFGTNWDFGGFRASAGAAAPRAAAAQGPGHERDPRTSRSTRRSAAPQKRVTVRVPGKAESETLDREDPRRRGRRRPSALQAARAVAAPDGRRRRATC